MVRLFCARQDPRLKHVRDRDSLQFIHPGWAYAQRDIAASTRATFRSLETQNFDTELCHIFVIFVFFSRAVFAAEIGS